MKYSHRTAIDILLTNNKSEVLLVQRNTPVGKNSWSFIGGRVKSDETLIQAINREIVEELGSDVSVCVTNEIIGVRDNCIPPDNIPHLTIVLKADYMSGSIINNDPDSNKQVKWFPLNKLPSNLFSGVEKIVNYYDNGRVILVSDYRSRK